VNDKPNQIRKVEFHNLKIGEESSFPIFEPLLILNIAVFNPEENFPIVKDYYGSNDRKEIIQKAQKTDCDVLGLKFNIGDIEQIPEAVSVLDEILPVIEKPLMIQGANNDDIDRILLPKLIEVLREPAIIASVNDNTYKDIVPQVIDGNHILVLKSPIDINLAKELNILSKDIGLSLDNILIDTDIGGLGYGLEYGYSIMEKIKLEGLKGDEYLNMPIISFAGEESLKTKEAKSDAFSESWGDIKKRAAYFELTAVSAAMAAGADVLVVNYPPNIAVMRGLK